MGNFITSYADCVDIFSTCRNPVQGKPLHGKGIRLYKGSDGAFRLTMYNRTFATITKDDVITFTLDERSFLSGVCSSLVYVMHRFISLGVYRVGTGRYRIGALKDYRFLKELPEYHGGIQFNLETGRCLNPKPDRKARVVPENRKQWLRCLREYRRGVLVRLKLGVRGTRDQDSSFDAKLLAQWMRDGVYHDNLFNHLSYWDTDYQSQAKAFDTLINDNRDVLRKEFGVFHD